MAHAWAQEARSNLKDPSPSDDAAIAVLQSLIEGASTPAAAADAVASLYEPALKREARERGSHRVDCPVWGLWGAVCTAVTACGADAGVRARVAAFLEALRGRPAPRDDDGGGEPIVVAHNGEAFWSDLPEFAFSFRVDAIGQPDPDDENPEAWRRFAAANAFAAEYVARYCRPGDMDRFNMYNYALWHAVDGLEWKGKYQPFYANAYVGVVTQWFLTATAHIFEWCRSKVDNDGTLEDRLPRLEDNTHLKHVVFQGQRGYSLERWAWWRKRFGDIANGELPVEEGLRETCARVVKEMERVESEQQGRNGVK